MTITAPRGKLIPTTGAAPLLNVVSPFTCGEIVEINSPASQTIYGCDHPSTTSKTKYALFNGDGATTVFTVPATMNALDTTNAAGQTPANQLRAVCLVNGAPLVRVGSDAAPAAGQFRCTTTTTFTLGSTYAKGTVIELIANDAADIVTLTGGATTAGRQYYVACNTFMYATGVANLVKAASI